MSTIVFESERVGDQFRGVVIDMASFDVIERTGTYASAETARSAAESLWRAKKAQEARAVVA
jgi:hypothetical protein